MRHGEPQPAARPRQRAQEPHGPDELHADAEGLLARGAGRDLRFALHERAERPGERGEVRAPVGPPPELLLAHDEQRRPAQVDVAAELAERAQRPAVVARPVDDHDLRVEALRPLEPHPGAIRDHHLGARRAEILGEAVGAVRALLDEHDADARERFDALLGLEVEVERGEVGRGALEELVVERPLGALHERAQAIDELTDHLLDGLVRAQHHLGADVVAPRRDAEDAGAQLLGEERDQLVDARLGSAAGHLARAVRHLARDAGDPLRHLVRARAARNDGDHPVAEGVEPVLQRARLPHDGDRDGRGRALAGQGGRGLSTSICGRVAQEDDQIGREHIGLSDQLIAPREIHAHATPLERLDQRVRQSLPAPGEQDRLRRDP